MKVINTRRTGKSMAIAEMKASLIMRGASITSKTSRGMETEYFELEGKQYAFISAANLEKEQ